MNKTLFPTSNGIVIHCQDKKVISAINCEGRKKIKSFQEKNKIVFWHIPFMRGLQYFFCGLYGLFQALILSYDLCNGTKRVKTKYLQSYYTKKMIVFIALGVIAVVMSAIVLGYLPGKLGYIIVDYRGSTFLRNCVICGLKIGVFYGFLLLLRVFPVVGEFFRFNKAGEKILRSQLKDKKSTKKLTKKQKIEKLQPNFLNFLVFVFVLDFLVVTLWGASYGFWFNLALNMAVFLLCISFSYELLFLVENAESGFVYKIGYVTGCLIYSRPTTTHLETVVVAVTEINLLCSQKGRELMDDENKKAFSVVYTEVKNKLANAGIKEKSEADWLIATVLKKKQGRNQTCFGCH